MSKYRYLDDAVLLALLLKEKDAIWQTAYAVFREPFVRFFQQLSTDTISIDEYLEVYEQSFTILALEISNEAIRSPLHTYLFHYLLIIGKKIMDKEHRSTWKGIGFKEALDHTSKYLAQDILLQLAVQMKDRDTVFSEFYKTYSQPAHDLINHKGNFKNKEAEDSYSDAMLTFWKNMIEKIIQSPFKGLLFNYFLVIFWRKTRDDTRIRTQQKKKTSENEEALTTHELGKKSKEWRVDMQEWQAYLKEPEAENNPYVEYLIEKWRVLQRFDFEEDEALAIQIIEQTEGRLKTILQLRYLEGLSFKDIAAQLDALKKTAHNEPETADTIRKAHFDGIKKLRKILNIFATKL